MEQFDVTMDKIQQLLAACPQLATITTKGENSTNSLSVSIVGEEVVYVTFWFHITWSRVHQHVWHTAVLLDGFTQFFTHFFTVTIN